MPGTFETIFVVAFDVDDHDQPVPAFSPRIALDEATALSEARVLERAYAGVAVWRRIANPAVGEEGAPDLIFTAGRIGDFD